MLITAKQRITSSAAEIIMVPALSTKKSIIVKLLSLLCCVVVSRGDPLGDGVVGHISLRARNVLRNALSNVGT